MHMVIALFCLVQNLFVKYIIKSSLQLFHISDYKTQVKFTSNNKKNRMSGEEGGKYRIVLMSEKKLKE